jgi:type VI secretion system secreted protein Hcp
MGSNLGFTSGRRPFAGALQEHTMALTAFLRLKAAKQGEILGSVATKGREGRIAVLESNHEISLPLDAGTGQATGRLQHQPFTVVKEIDRATPALYQALLTGEVFTEFELQYWARKGGAAAGAEVNHYTVRLKGARITHLRFVQPDVLDPALKAFPEAEELSFGYDAIEWQWNAPLSVASGSWHAGSPRVVSKAKPRPSRRLASAE